MLLQTLLALAATPVALASTCALGEIGHGDLRCNSPYLQVNYYSDSGCGNFIGFQRYTDQASNGKCIPTGWAGLNSAVIANWNGATKWCIMYTGDGCTGTSKELDIFGPTEGEETHCVPSPPNDGFRSIQCFWN
ncbi:hypothetical protein NQ176_g3875 [Zarea fungicola]|uniref:Uncharacterized protein n=1 Tax=Zarea fungicola TaxID=93591 RepID=A0ACC1NH01_9HYPO|nr:hypothetical protein NQ176_g3875 [Lecanicillium fungicola]